MRGSKCDGDFDQLRDRDVRNLEISIDEVGFEVPEFSSASRRIIPSVGEFR